MVWWGECWFPGGRLFHIVVFRRYWVVTTGGERAASTEAFQGKDGSSYRTKCLNCFDRVFTACGNENARAAKMRSNQGLVEPDGDDQRYSKNQVHYAVQDRPASGGTRIGELVR